MITKGDLIKDLNDWRNGKMGINALTDAIDTYAQQQAKNISSNPHVSESLFSFLKWYKKTPMPHWAGLERTIKEYIEENNIR